MRRLTSDSRIGYRRARCRSEDLFGGIFPVNTFVSVYVEAAGNRPGPPPVRTVPGFPVAAKKT